jgi:hypothetical protein
MIVSDCLHISNVAPISLHYICGVCLWWWYFNIVFIVADSEDISWNWVDMLGQNRSNEKMFVDAIRVDGKQKFIHIKHITIEQQGTYTCHLRDATGKRIGATSIQVVVKANDRSRHYAWMLRHGTMRGYNTEAANRLVYCGWCFGFLITHNKLLACVCFVLSINHV